MSGISHNGDTILCTVTGTVVTVAANIGSSDIIKTVVLAAVGASVSFFVSLLLKWLFKPRKRL